MAIIAKERIGPYMCSIHGVWMIPMTSVFTHPGGIKVAKLQYYGCPVANCKQVKPNKYERRSINRVMP